MFPDGLAPSGSDDIRVISFSKQKVPQPGEMAVCGEAEVEPGKMSSSWKPHPKHPKKDLQSLSLQELMTRALIMHPLSKRILNQSLRGVWGLPFPSRAAPIHDVPPGSVGTFVLLPTDQPQRVRWQPSNTRGLARGRWMERGSGGRFQSELLYLPAL